MLDLFTPETTADELRGVLRYTLELPQQTPSTNDIKNLHWGSYQTIRRKWRILVHAALGGTKPVKPLMRSRIEVDRYCAGALDWDNALGGLKPLFDCLVTASDRNPDGLGLIANDDPVHVPLCPIMTQHKARQKQGRTTVRIYELPPAPVVALQAKTPKKRRK